MKIRNKRIEDKARGTTDKKDKSLSRVSLSFFLSLASLIHLLSPAPSFAASSDYVRTANYFLMSGTTLDNNQTRETLFKFDLLVLPAEAQLYNKDFFTAARKANPDIIILAYVPTTSWNMIWTDSLHTNLKSGIKSSWWLKDTTGKQVSVWPGTQALDLSSGWSDYLADWTVKNVLSTGYWDGVFYDEVSAEISWVGSVSVTDSQWVDGLANLFSKTRAKVGSNKIIFMNGSSNSKLQPYVNGRMFESFPTPWEGNGSWDTVMKNYLALQDQVGYDPIFILNGNSNNTGNKTDYQKVRFGLTSTLMGDGYFGYDYGTESHNQTWYYDEYDVYLGEPIEAGNKNSAGVWERDFAKGKAIVNPTSSSQTIRLGGDYEKIHGTQDSTTNNGRIVSSVTLNANDGLLLLRTIETLENAVFSNGSFVRIFNADGSTKRNGFFAYDDAAKGGAQVITFDVDGDGKRETVTADENQVQVIDDDGTVHASFYPYTEAYKGGVNISVGDLENDGTVEIVTGTENGGGPQIRIFNHHGKLINPGFFAYDTAFRGGVNVSIGDLNGDGWKEIIAGAGVGGGPHVRVFNRDGKVINPGFFAYDESFRGGVNVAVGDLDGNGIDEIITGPGKGGGPQIKVFDKSGTIINSGFFAYDSSDRTGVEVSAVDLDGDDLDEIVAIGSDVFTL